MGPIEETRYRLRLDIPIETVFDALTDFGPRRAEFWRETSHPRTYAVHHLDNRSAEVTEGVPFAWSRERYEWERPTRVRLTQLESNVARNGTIQYLMTAEGDGTAVECVRYREFFGMRGRVAGTLMVLAGPALLKRQLKAGLQRYAEATR